MVHAQAVVDSDALAAVKVDAEAAKVHVEVLVLVLAGNQWNQSENHLSLGNPMWQRILLLLSQRIANLPVSTVILWVRTKRNV